MSSCLVRVPLLLCALLNAGVAAERVSSARDAAARLEVLGLTADGATITKAIAAGQRPLVKMLLAAAPDVNGADASGDTPLVAATLAGEWDLVPQLLAAGSNANTADRHSTTPLMAAAARGHLPTLRALLERGALPEARDQNGRGALHYAIAAKHFEAFNELLAAASRANSGDSVLDREALGLAVETQQWRFIGAVLERSTAPASWDFAGRSALAQALKEKNVEKVRLVLSKHSGDPSPEGRTQPLLAYAAAVNDLALGRLMLEAGANANTLLGSPIDGDFLEQLAPKFLKHYVADEPGMSALMVAAGLGHTEFVNLLLEKGANRTLSTRSKHHLVALYFAAWGEHPETIQTLLGSSPSESQVRIDIDLSSQRVTLYKDSAPVLSSNISSGRSGFATPTGRFVITDKRQHHISSIYKVPMPYFMRLNCRDFGMHEGYVTGSPASHGCIRLPGKIAQRMFKEVPVGTLVTISR